MRRCGSLAAYVRPSGPTPTTLSCMARTAATSLSAFSIVPKVVCAMKNEVLLTRTHGSLR